MSQSRTSWLHSRTVQLVIGVTVSLICLWWAVSGLFKDPDALTHVRNAFAKANYWTLVPMWVALVGFYLLKAWRWRLLLKPVGDFRVVRELVPPTMIGFAFNNLLPAHLGDFVRVFLFARQRGLTKTAVLSSVVLERVFDIVAILLFLGIGLVFVPDMPASVRQSAFVFAAATAAIISGALVYVIWTQPFVRFMEFCLRKSRFVPKGFEQKLTGMLTTGAEGLSSLKSPQLLIGILSTSLAQWALNGLQVYLSLRAFGIEVSPLVACIVLGVVAFGVTVPSSPGYFGVIQLCFMTVLQLFTNDQANVFAASVYYHLAQYIPVTLVGLYFFNATGLRIAEVEAKAESEREARDSTPLEVTPAPGG